MVAKSYEGSLDNPPIVVRGAAWKTLLAMLGCIGFVALAWFLADKQPQIALLTFAFFGFGAVALVVRLFRPAWVRFSPQGIAIYSGWKERAIVWSDFDEFRLVRVRHNLFVGFTMSSSFTGKLALSGANRALAGIDGALPNSLTLAPRDLAELVQAAAKKWSPRPIPFIDDSD